MAEPTPISFPLFDFMDIRSPQDPSPRRRRRGFIDDFDAPKHGPFRKGVPDQDELPDVSPITKIVTETVGLWTGAPSDPAAMETLKVAIIGAHAKLHMVKHTPPGVSEPGVPQAKFSDLETGVWLSDGEGDLQRLYLLPDHPGRIDAPSIMDGVQAAGKVLDSHLAEADLDRNQLVADLEAVLRPDPIEYYAWGGPRNDDSLLWAHRALFDALYLMYVTRRWTGHKNLEPLIAGLQTLHVAAVLGADVLLEKIWEDDEVTEEQSKMLNRLAATWPELQRPLQRWWQPWTIVDLEGWSREPLIASLEDLRIYRKASPVIQPLFAKLFWKGRPFNDIKPIGCGDLKVVRDRLDRYHAVDIADIQNVMKGETRRRTHNRLDRVETTFSLDETTLNDTTKDTQATERFEVKSAAERVLRDQQTLNVSANTSLTYGGVGSVQVSASAGLAYASSRSFEDHLETSRAFARDVVDRAVERVETKRAISRSTTTIVETNERNFHEFTSSDSHTSGIYQWVEAEYTAQVFSYGRRTMFEFMVPEPAAFWVAATLAGHEETLDVPQPPKKPELEVLKLPVQDWTKVEPDLLPFLSGTYGLRDLPEPPPPRKRIVLRRAENGSSVFDNGGGDIPDEPPNPSLLFDAKLEGATGYTARVVRIVGGWTFHNNDEKNRLVVALNGVEVLAKQGDLHYFTGNIIQSDVSGLDFANDSVSAHFVFTGKAKQLSLGLAVDLARSPALYEEWQKQIFTVLQNAETERVNARNDELNAEYGSALAQYNAAIEQVRATPIVELLEGGPQRENRRVIAMELKKHCISMIAKEFDTDGEDDSLESLQPTGNRVVQADRTRLKVIEAPNLEEETTARFVTEPKAIDYPAIKLSEARRKGRLVQFLDQAFEWEKISYLFFDYFYANMPRWVELINREDAADPLWAAFLSAGQARILISVTPNYEVAVQHFLETREPWNGTNADPVLDDPLFIPLFDEVRSRTDDRSGGTPCGDPWTYRVPISLPYLRGSETRLPDLEQDRKDAAEGNSDGWDGRD